MTRASDLDWTWLANLPLGPRRATLDELLVVDRGRGRRRSGDRLVPDGGGGSGAAGRLGEGTAESLRFVRAPPGPARSGAGVQLARLAWQVPPLPSTDRHRPDRHRAVQCRPVRADGDPLRGRACGHPGLLHPDVGAARPDVDRPEDQAPAARDHLHRHARRCDRVDDRGHRDRRTRTHLDDGARRRDRARGDVADLRAPAEAAWATATCASPRCSACTSAG